jgi:hypothetical protein
LKRPGEIKGIRKEKNYLRIEGKPARRKQIAIPTISHRKTILILLLAWTNAGQIKREWGKWGTNEFGLF